MAVFPPSVTSVPPFVPPRPAGGGRWLPGSKGVVHLDGNVVGTLTVTGWDASWGFGRFTAEPGFAAYAPAFRRWSLLMHADGDDRPLSRATSDELVHAENRLDRIKARIFFPADDAWVDVFQLNIDGELLEWKEY